MSYVEPYGGSALKNSPAMQKIQEMPQVWSLGCEDPWRRAWQPIPVFLPWRIPWTEEPDRLQSTASHRVGCDWAHNAHILLFPYKFLLLSSLTLSASLGLFVFIFLVSWVEILAIYLQSFLQNNTIIAMDFPLKLHFIGFLHKILLFKSI